MTHARLFELWTLRDRKRGEALGLALFELGIAGLVERNRGKRRFWVAYASSKREARALAEKIRRLGAEVEIEEVDGSGWQTEWMRYLEPETLTDRIVFVPVTKSFRTRRNERVLRFEPDQVFGVGSHPTTRLAAVAVERQCVRKRPARVLDVGTGTGVLAMVAVISGAERALGIDVERRAVRSARKNAALNSLERQARFSERALARVRDVFDLVVANIELRSLEPLARDLVRVTDPAGTLLVTGVLERARKGLEKRFRALGMRRVRLEREGEWVLLELRRAPRWASPGKVGRNDGPR
jgi:ribosomal protein L11 methyltransferase